MILDIKNNNTNMHLWLLTKHLSKYFAKHSWNISFNTDNDPKVSTTIIPIL